MAKSAIVLVATGGLVALIVLLGCLVLFSGTIHGQGMRSTYQPTDYDEILTPIAETAVPLISALRRYHDSHSQYPADEKFDEAVADDPILEKRDANSNGWFYRLEQNGAEWS